MSKGPINGKITSSSTKLFLEGSSPLTSIKSELKSGLLVTLEECARRYDQLEHWTQILFYALERRVKLKRAS